MNPTCTQCGTLQPKLSREESIQRFKSAIGRCLYDPSRAQDLCQLRLYGAALRQGR